MFRQGKDWTSLRRPISKYMLTPTVVQKFVPDFNDISSDLVDYVRRHKNSQTGDMVLSDSASSFFKLTHECISQFMLGERPNLLKEDFQTDHMQVVDSIQDFLCLAGELLFEVPLYMIYPTKKWRVAVQAQNKAIDEITKLVVERMERVMAEGAHNEDATSNLLLHMLGTGSMSTTSIIHNTVSLLVAGIDSTSYTLLFTLHCIGQNPQVQEDLKKEIDSVWNGEDPLTVPDLGKMKLLSSCIREAQRLYPAAPFNARLTKKDLVLSGHHVPSGSTVLMPFYAMGRMKEYFDNPEVFDPYRWMRAERGIERFASLPFGFGARMCIGKRIAEMQLKMSTAYLLKNFKLESPENFNVIQNVFLNADRKVPMKFSEVN
jgi:cytochrome P450